MFLNFDVKYIDIDTKAKLATTGLGTQTVKISLDPFVFGVGVGFRL
jgi:outer membrane protein